MGSEMCIRDRAYLIDPKDRGPTGPIPSGCAVRRRSELQQFISVCNFYNDPWWRDRDEPPVFEEVTRRLGYEMERNARDLAYAQPVLDDRGRPKGPVVEWVD